MGKESGFTGLTFVTLGNKYLHLVKNILEENINQGQDAMSSYDHNSTSEEIHESTKWFYHTIIVPMLFNFYHGLELTIKGFLVRLPDYNLSTTHQMTVLLNDFKKNYQDQTSISEILEKYIIVDRMPLYLKTWFLENEFAIDDYHNFFGYPFDKNLKNYVDYSRLKYDLDKDARGIDLSKSMLEDVNIFLSETTRVFNSSEELT